MRPYFKTRNFASYMRNSRALVVLAVELIEQALLRKLPFSTVLMDSWYLAPDVVAALNKHQLDWVSLLKKNRKLEVNSFVLRDELGQPHRLCRIRKRIALTSPHIKVEDLVPLIPKTAYRKVKVGEKSKRVFYSQSASSGIGKSASGHQF